MIRGKSGPARCSPQSSGTLPWPVATCSSFARLGAIIAPLVVFSDTYRPGMSILVYGVVAAGGRRRGKDKI